MHQFELEIPRTNVTFTVEYDYNNGVDDVFCFYENQQIDPEGFIVDVSGFGELPKYVQLSEYIKKRCGEHYDEWLARNDEPHDYNRFVMQNRLKGSELV